MPLKIIQQNDRVAEVQFICDKCGKLLHTSLIPKKEVEVHKKITLTCCQCNQAKPTKSSRF